MTKNAVETAPACHFWNGGIVIDEWCKTTVPGLWAAGEGTALIHGANRLSGNALTMTQVWGPRAGIDAARAAKENGLGEVDREQVGELRQKVFQFLGRQGENPIELRNRLRRMSHLRAGPVRDDEATIQEALNEVVQMKKEWGELGTRVSDPIYNQEWIEAIQDENLLACAEMVLRASLMRRESRGAAYRRDFPETNNRDWLKNIVIRQNNGEMDLTVRPIVVTSMTPPSDIRKYGQKHVIEPAAEH
jgi:succinate dehydrogenase/fumarate reductase flavoprotein subunit